MFFSRVLLTLSLCVCFGGAVYAAPLRIVAITEDFGDIASLVGGKHVEVEVLVKGSRNLHHINPKPSMVMKVKKADLLIRLGMGQDSWIDGLVQVARNNKVLPDQLGYLDASERINRLEVPEGKIDGSMGDVHKYGNPHYWLSPHNGIVIARHVRDVLSQLSPKNAAEFEKNYAIFAKQIEEKIPVWERQLKDLKTRDFVTYHKVWSYFFEAFNLTSLGELEPVPGIPPTTGHLAELKKRVARQSPPPTVITASFYPESSAISFAKSIGSKHTVLPTNVGGEIQSYEELLDTLVKRLSQ